MPTSRTFPVDPGLPADASYGEDLRAAADEVGTRQAIRQLGDLHGLAAGFLDAEYGDLSKRPSWTAVAIFLVVADVALLIVGHVGANAFRAGVLATNPSITGTFHWHGIRYLISDSTFSFRAGTSTSDGGAWTPLVYLLLAVGAVLAGRLWRLAPRWRRSLSPDR